MIIRKKISAATEGTVEPSETIIYALDLNELLDILRKNKENIITIWQLEKKGFDAINFKSSLWGSGVIDDMLYLMKTDGKDILIDGHHIDPESVIEDIQEGKYEIDVLAPYIQETDEKYVRIAVSPAAMITPDFDKAAQELLGEESFFDIVKAAEEYDEFDE